MDPAEKSLMNLKKTDQIICLPCNKLKDHPLRNEFYSQSHLEELTLSIRETGLLDPIAVCPLEDGNYRILCGHYRIRAVRRLGMKEVQCRVVNCDERLSFITYCTSNILSRSMNVIEEASVISTLLSDGKFKAADIAKLWGKSTSWVSRRQGLIKKLNPQIRKDVEDGHLSSRIAQELARLPQGKNQDTVLEIIRRNKFNKDVAASLVTWCIANTSSPDTKDISVFFDSSATILKTIKSRNQIRSAQYELLKCILSLDQLILAVQKEKTLNWWPCEIYQSFKRTAACLSKILDERFGSKGVPDNEKNI